MNEEKRVRKLFGKKKMVTMTQTLDRLIQEARQTVAPVLKVFHGFRENMKMVMDGEQIHQTCRPLGVEDISL
jgi:hypothetical protein